MRLQIRIVRDCQDPFHDLVGFSQKGERFGWLRLRSEQILDEHVFLP